MTTPEQFNKWRVVPRVLVFLYGYICYQTAEWFTSLQAPTTEQVAYATVIWGAAAAWFGLYVNSGGKND